MKLTRLIEAVGVAVRGLAAHRLRTLLTALSVAIGCGAITLMTSLSASGVATIASGIEAIGGTRLILAVPRRSETSPRHYDRGLTHADADAMRARVPGLSTVAFVAALPHQPLIGNGRTIDVDIAAGSAFRALIFPDLACGADVPNDAAGGRSRVVVLSHAIATRLFATPQGALDRTVMLWSHAYRVIGVAGPSKRLGFDLGAVDDERAVFVAAPVLARDEGIEAPGFVLLTDDRSTPHDRIVAVASQLLRARHAGRDDVEMVDMADALRQWNAVFRALTLLTGVLAGLSLVIAGAGITNVLAVAVSERVAEIGLRRAVGATRLDVARQFLVESTLLGALGGAFGTVVALALSLVAGAVARHFVPAWEARIVWGAAGASLAFALLIGVTFGMRPARRAARLDVVACLRGDG